MHEARGLAGAEVVGDRIRVGLARIDIERAGAGRPSPKADGNTSGAGNERTGAGQEDMPGIGRAEVTGNGGRRLQVDLALELFLLSGHFDDLQSQGLTSRGEKRGALGD